MSNTTEFGNNEANRASINEDKLAADGNFSSFTWTSDRSVSEQVVQAVADVVDCSVTEIEPLNNAVDADALNNLFSAKLDGTMRRGGHLAFEYADHSVTVFASGRIEIADGI